MGTNHDDEKTEFRTISMSQPYGSHRFSVWSPKLQRPLTLYGEDDVDVWANLELDPRVSCIVERPHRIKLENRNLVFNFYVESSDKKSLLVIADDDTLSPLRHSISNHIGIQSLIEDRKITIEYWAKSFIKEKSVYIENCKAVLHSLSANYRFLTDDLKRRVQEVISCTASATLNAIKESLTDEDPILVTASVYSMLSAGSLSCSNIEVDSLCDSSEFRLTNA